MEAIRQFVKVKNHKVNITLPDDFIADEVDVIILSKHDNFVLTNEMIEILDSRTKEPIENFITAEESLNRLKNKYRF